MYLRTYTCIYEHFQLACNNAIILLLLNFLIQPYSGQCRKQFIDKIPTAVV